MITVEKIHTFTGHSGSIYALAKGIRPFTLLSGSSDKFLAQWDLQTLTPDTFSAKFPSMVYSVCAVYECNLLLIGTSTGGIHVIDLVKKEEVKFIQLDNAAIFDIKASLKQGQFYCCNAGGKFCSFSLETFQLLNTFAISPYKLRNIAINQNENELSIADGSGHIHILSLPDLLIKKAFIAHEQSCNALIYHPTDPVLISGGKDAHLKVWRSGDFELIKSIPAHNYAIYDIKYLSSFGIFATASRDKTIKLWDKDINFLLRINKENYDGHVNSVNKLYWDDELGLLASAGDDRSIMMWKLS
jgi:WD40 repeat protein